MKPCVHFWDLGNASPVFACGRAPSQGIDGQVLVSYRTGPALAAFRRLRRRCRACWRVIEAVERRVG
jgi:hypothetical protein